MNSFNWPVIGHQKIINYLQSVVERNSPNHAYLFYGPPGIGKNLVADLFVKSLFCASANAKPCGTCAHCRQLAAGSHPDVIDLIRETDQKNINIERIREARSQVQNYPFFNSYKVLFIREADTLSLGASNALLKILEEPRGQTIFVFIGENLKFFPRTVLSRLQVIKFLPINEEEIEKYLVAQKIDRPLARELAAASLGFPGRVWPFINHPKNFHEHTAQLSLLLQKAFSQTNERFRLIENLASQSNSEAAKKNSRDFLNDLLFIVRDSLLVKSGLSAHITFPGLESDLAFFARRHSAASLINILSEIRKTSHYLKQNVNPRLALENLILSF
ncbi:MAG TPA: DNA polymerase III subunit delta' C-terminal domain-containing protein [bacterium]|nr:DNA polymerase III subunit delta' C-terminal domain-containing protein [bacterium]